MIYAVIGTKAQLIKMAPVLRRMQDRGVPFRYISTGQHQETIADLLENFGVREPDVVLYEGKDITSIPQMLRWSLRILFKTLFRRREIFGPEIPRNSIVLVHGDTFSTALGAVMGRLAGLKVGHVESGLRSFNLLQPFPEELTRLFTFSLSHVYFCPGPWAVENLKRFKGIKVDTGSNTLCDAMRYALPAADQVDPAIVPATPFGVVTLHRFENFRDAEATLKIVEAVELIAARSKLLFILHAPTRENLKRHGFYERLAANPRIELRPRYDYFRFMKLLTAAEFVVSDGGSNQEECSYLGTPMLLLRNVTERQEGLGRNVVVSGFDGQVIAEFLDHLDKYRFPPLALPTSPSDLIIDHCLDYV